MVRARAGMPTKYLLYAAGSLSSRCSGMLLAAAVAEDDEGRIIAEADSSSAKLRAASLPDLVSGEVCA